MQRHRRRLRCRRQIKARNKSPLSISPFVLFNRMKNTTTYQFPARRRRRVRSAAVLRVRVRGFRACAVWMPNSARQSDGRGRCQPLVADDGQWCSQEERSGVRRWLDSDALVGKRNFICLESDCQLYSVFSFFVYNLRAQGANILINIDLIRLPLFIWPYIRDFWLARLFCFLIGLSMSPAQLFSHQMRIFHKRKR